MALVNANTEFPITLEEAKQVLSVEPNQYRVPGHSELDQETFPKVDDFEAFYVHRDAIRRSNLARVMGPYQNVVWSTGTHTNTPVPLIALGQGDIEKRFSRLMHTTEWATTVMKILE